jgi:uncharacterized protein YdiU (UPF0061 family)
VRETVLPGALIVRVASSHIRVGTFQFFAARGDVEALRLLADHVIERHYPAAADAGHRYLALLEKVIAAQAELVARWLAVGFIPALFEQAYNVAFRRKIGLSLQREEDPGLIAALLDLLSREKADFTLFFRRLSAAQLAGDGQAGVQALFANPAPLDEWLAQWRFRLQHEPHDIAARSAAMNAVNPAFIPRNHRVEAMIRAAVDKDDFTLFEELLLVLSRPYDDQPDFLEYENPPLEEERVLATFCGT